MVAATAATNNLENIFLDVGFIFLFFARERKNLHVDTEHDMTDHTNNIDALLMKSAHSTKLMLFVHFMVYLTVISHSSSLRYYINNFMSCADRKLPLSSVVAVTPSWGIGNKGKLPWQAIGKNIPTDIAYFKRITSHTNDLGKFNAVIMGRATWESIPAKYRPLSGRLNVIVSNSLSRTQESFEPDSNILVATSLDNALQLIIGSPLWSERVERAVVIGGARLFEESLFHPWFTTLHLTQIDNEFESDTVLTPKTIEWMKQQNFDSHVVQDNVIESGVHYK